MALELNENQEIILEQWIVPKMNLFLILFSNEYIQPNQKDLTIQFLPFKFEKNKKLLKCQSH